jgi:hypothetical protein
VRIVHDRLAKGLQRLVEALEIAEHDTEPVVGRGEVRPQSQGLAEALGGFVQAPQSLQGHTEVAQGFGVFRPQPQRHAAATGGALELPQEAVGLGEVGVEGRYARPQGNGPADQLHGPPLLAPLVGEHAQQVQGVGLLGVVGQDSPVGPRRLVEGAALVVVDRRVQLVGPGRHHENTLLERDCATLLGPY